MTKRTDAYAQPHEVSELQAAFPARLGKLLPEWHVIAEDFRHDTKESMPWRQFQSDWMFKGISRSVLTPREGVDMDAALRHLKCIQQSFEPKHEHKEAAVAWLASRWFSAVSR